MKIDEELHAIACDLIMRSDDFDEASAMSKDGTLGIEEIDALRLDMQQIIARLDRVGFNLKLRINAQQLLCSAAKRANHG